MPSMTGRRRGFPTFARRSRPRRGLAEAILLQAEARLELTNYAGAIELLSAHQGAAGTNADEYLFWLAEAHARKGDYRAAERWVCETGQRVPRLVPLPGGGPRGGVGARGAGAHGAVRMAARDRACCSRRTGCSRQRCARMPRSDLVPRGCLLLSEAQLATKDYPGAEATLQPLAKRLLGPKRAWQWQYSAVPHSTGGGADECGVARARRILLALAVNAGQTNLQADSAEFQASLLERLGRTDEALTAYQKNLAEGVPAERQRTALLKTTALSLAQTNIPQAMKTLEKFLGQYPKAAAADLALLTLGELRLRQHESGADTNLVVITATNAPAATNGLQLAAASIHRADEAVPAEPVIRQGATGPWMVLCLGS